MMMLTRLSGHVVNSDFRLLFARASISLCVGRIEKTDVQLYLLLLLARNIPFDRNAHWRHQIPAEKTVVSQSVLKSSHWGASLANAPWSIDTSASSPKLYGIHSFLVTMDSDA
jgi:hypothetical protein